jgi:acetyl esterase
MALDPDAQRVLDLIRDSGRPSVETMAPPEARAFYRTSRGALQPEPEQVAEVKLLAASGPEGDIALRWYRGLGTDPESKLPALVYFHGGGWVIGDLDTHDGVCRSFANAAQCVVVSVDYRLAPEHRFPVAVEDCSAATRWVVENAERLGIDPSRVAVGGDSAGGKLAAVMALFARDGAIPPVCGQLLIYPATDLMTTHPGYQRITEGFPLTASTSRWFINHYIADRSEALDWRASPLRAADLSGTAPALVLTASYDPLCEEGEAYAKRLERDGVRVAYINFADQIHGFLTMGRVIRASGTAIKIMSAWLRDMFSR